MPTICANNAFVVSFFCGRVGFGRGGSARWTKSSKNRLRGPRSKKKFGNHCCNRFVNMVKNDVNSCNNLFFCAVVYDEENLFENVKY